MEIIPFQPSETWDSVRRNFLIFVTLGVVGVMFVTMLTLPVTYIKAAHVAGKQALKTSTAIVNYGSTAAHKTLQTCNKVLEKVAVTGKTVLRDLGDRAMEAANFIHRLIVKIYLMAGKSVRFSIVTINDLTDAMTKASNFLLQNIIKLSEGAIKGINAGFEKVMNVIDWTAETVHEMIKNLLIPLVKTSQNTVYETAENAYDIFTKLLPRYV